LQFSSPTTVGIASVYFGKTGKMLILLSVADAGKQGKDNSGLLK
jgi:hypothetical protein